MCASIVPEHVRKYGAVVEICVTSVEIKIEQEEKEDERVIAVKEVISNIKNTIGHEGEAITYKISQYTQK